ncbi:MAG TPA: hypothetical protein VNG93_06025 [Candidatus Dormibacteraeota bacterium]|nr:hypothetical protein [Candidatus Dormibacteraeota bacterium]
MAGTSWDKLGLMDAAFEVVGPAIRRAAEAEGVKLLEFHRDDPLWRLAWARSLGGEASVDVEWTEDEPDTYWLVATWFRDDWDSAMRRQHVEEVGEFTRDQAPEKLEAMLRDAVERVDGWTEADLDEESGPYPEWKQYQSRDEFGRTRLPVR